MIKSDDFAELAINYSTAGHPLCLVAEREIVAPFFRKLYQFLSTNNNQANLSAGSTFEIGGVNLKLKGKYTLGHLPALLSTQYETFIDEALEQKNVPSQTNLYRTVFCGDKVNQTDRQLIKQFLQQWQHPLSQWLTQGCVTASKIDRIRQLRNRASHAETIEFETTLYRWQFNLLWQLLVSSKTHPGVLQEIYANSNSLRNHAARLKGGIAASGSPSYSYLVGSACS